MSPITDAARRGWSWVHGSRHEPHGWMEAHAAALTVAGFDSIHPRPETIRAVVVETQHRYGGPEGVAGELSRRLAGAPREVERTRKTLDWARRTLGEVSGC